MGSIAVIVVFFAFILVGFAIEAQRSKVVTNAVWLPLFWMGICGSRSVGQWLNISNYNIPSSEAEIVEANLGGSPVDQIVLTIAIFLGIIMLFRRGKSLVRVFKNNKALLAFIIYLGMTVYWSDVSAVSFRGWVKLTCNFVMAAVLITEPEPLEAIRSVFRRLAYLLIPLSVMLIKYFRQVGVLYTAEGEALWIGVAVMKNGLAHLCFVISFFLVWDMISTWGRKMEMKFSGGLYGMIIKFMLARFKKIDPAYYRTLFDIIILMMSLWLLLGRGHSISAASKGCLIVGIVILIGSRMSVIKRNFGKIGVLAILTTCLFLVLESLFGIIELTVTSLGRDMTFTERVPLWNILLDLGMREPLLGYGYGGFWIGDRSFILGLSQAHNGYLELFLEGGWVAIILLGVLLVSVFRKIQRNSLLDYENTVFRLCFLMMILLANVTETAFARERDLLTFVFFLIAMNDAAPIRVDQHEKLLRRL